MSKADISVGTLVDMIGRGEIRLPEMQRRYVWRAPRVRDLIDSLYRGYPSGAILVWETDEELPARNLAVEQGSSMYLTRKLLLDGQQRLTSLFAVLQGKPVTVRGRRKPIDILFNLDHPETLAEVEDVDDDDEDDDDSDDDDDSEDEISLHERLRQMTFVVASQQMRALPNWVSVTEVLGATSDKPFLKAAGVTDMEDERYDRYSERLKRLREIRNYPYAMHVLDRNLSYEEVAEIFVRVNSLGMKLRSTDLALAQITARWKNLLPELGAFQDECEQRNFTLDQGMLIRSMVVFASGQSRFRSLKGISTASLQDGWLRAKEGLRFAVNFLSTNGGIEDETLLSSPFFLPGVAYAFECAGGKLSRHDERALLEWVLVGSGRGYFGSSSETRLDADLARLRRSEGPESLVQNLEQLFGRRRFDVGDLAGRGTKSGLYGLAFLALRRLNAKDWKSGLGISLQHRGKQFVVQSHHIFPRARMRDCYEKREINEIANRAFISGSTNRWFSDTLPSGYLPGVVEERGGSALTTQCVPTDSQLWEIDKFPDFLRERRTLLVQAINSMLDNL